jgi:hypothetical protein
MMLALNLTISSKTLIQQFAVLHSCHVDHAPSGNAIAAPSANLPAEQPDNSILNAVIVRFDYSLVAFVPEPDQLLILNCTIKQLM